MIGFLVYYVNIEIWVYVKAVMQIFQYPRQVKERNGLKMRLTLLCPQVAPGATPVAREEERDINQISPT